MIRARKPGWMALLLVPFLLIAAYAATLSTTSLKMIPGETTYVTLSNIRGSVAVRSSNTAVATASYASSKVKVVAKAPGSATVTVKDRSGSKSISVTVVPVMTVAPTSLSVVAGGSATVTVKNPFGTISVTNFNQSYVSTSLSGNVITVTGKAAGFTNLAISDTKTTIMVPVTVTGSTGSGTGARYALLAWNDLGMHCMDADYSVFSILPPYNNLHAQLVDNSNGAQVTSGVSLTYEPQADPTNSINSHSTGKTNFWTYVGALFGVTLPAEKGLAGSSMPSQSPQPLKFDTGLQMFVAEGIPITPKDDAGLKNPYPLVKVVARDSAGTVLATARVVLPVSDEMSCKSCHASTASTNQAQQAARPAAGWVYDADAERDYRRNILRLHDEKSAASATFQSALSTKGYAPGLLASADAGRPVLCAACHASNALPGTGIAGIKPLTQSMHAQHGTVTDPSNGLQLDATSNRSACYQCHPGSTTKCLRGAMSGADMQCQSCHGKMSNVGASTRVGWLEQPNCQACHHDGKRETSAVTTSGTLNTWTDARFATNANTPATGFSLYRFSKGHGNLQCESCHGATHAEYSGAAKDPNLPLNHYNDNLFSQDLQGHAGAVEDCKVCHASVPLTMNGGPHGLHTLGQAWVDGHEDLVEGQQSTCTYCHGADYRGGPLATVKANRTFKIDDGRTKSYSAGQTVGCYDCHNGPSGD